MDINKCKREVRRHRGTGPCRCINMLINVSTRYNFLSVMCSFLLNVVFFPISSTTLLYQYTIFHQR